MIEETGHSKIISLADIRQQRAIREPDPAEEFYADLVATMRGADASQIVTLLAAAHETEVLDAIATELRELVDRYRSWLSIG